MRPSLPYRCESSAAAVWDCVERSLALGEAEEMDSSKTYLSRVDFLTAEGVVVGTHDGSWRCVSCLLNRGFLDFSMMVIAITAASVGHVIVRLS